MMFEHTNLDIFMSHIKLMKKWDFFTDCKFFPMSELICIYPPQGDKPLFLGDSVYGIEHVGVVAPQLHW